MKSALLSFFSICLCVSAQTFSIVTNQGPGTVSVTNGNTTITGTSTAFSAAYVGTPLCDGPNMATAHCVYITSESSSTAAVFVSGGWTGTTNATMTYYIGQIAHGTTNATETVTFPFAFQSSGTFFVGGQWIGNSSILVPPGIVDSNGGRQYTSQLCSVTATPYNQQLFWQFDLTQAASPVSVTFNETSADFPDDIWGIEVAYTAGYYPVFDVSSCGTTTTTMTTVAGDFVWATGKGSALTSPYTAWPSSLTSTGGYFGYVLSSGTSVVTQSGATSTAAAAVKLVPTNLTANTGTAMGGTANIGGSASINTGPTPATIAIVGTPPSMAAANSTTATTAAYNTTGATFFYCSTGSLSAQATTWNVTDSVNSSTGWIALGVIHGASSGYQQSFYNFTGSAGSAQTFKVTVGTSGRISIGCFAFSGMPSGVNLLDYGIANSFQNTTINPNQNATGSTSCTPPALQPSGPGQVFLFGGSGNNLTGSADAINDNTGVTWTIKSASGTLHSVMGYYIAPPGNANIVRPHSSNTGDTGQSCTLISWKP